MPLARRSLAARLPLGRPSGASQVRLGPRSGAVDPHSPAGKRTDRGQKARRCRARLPELIERRVGPAARHAWPSAATAMAEDGSGKFTVAFQGEKGAYSEACARRASHVRADGMSLASASAYIAVTTALATSGGPALGSCTGSR